MLLDLPFAFPVADAGYPLGAADRAVDEVFDACFAGGIGEILFLQYLAFRPTDQKSYTL